MAMSAALSDRHIVSTILASLSDMKYKDRRQYGPDEPVQFLEFRPTLVPAILVNKLWADEGTSILCLLRKRYPHLPVLKYIAPERRQYYANKVHNLFALSPPLGSAESLDYLDSLSWPNLKSLELEVDFERHGLSFVGMLHDGLEHLELLGEQSGRSNIFVDTVLPAIFGPCKSLKRIRIGPDTISAYDPVHVSTLYEYLDACPSITTIEVKFTNLMEKDALFTRLSQRKGLEGLGIELDPGLALLPSFSGPNALPSPFQSLRSLSIMCYPEIALALPRHLQQIGSLQLDIARIPDSSPQASDFAILDDILVELSHCSKLRSLKVGIGPLAIDFPSATLFPKLSGSTLVRLAEGCPDLEDINLLASSGIDGSMISSDDFDKFCQSLPRLRSLSLKFQPTTTSALKATALQSLGHYCPELEVLRLKTAFQLPDLPILDTAHPILAGGDEPAKELPSQQDREAIFRKVVHFALSRPDTALAPIDEAMSGSMSSHTAPVVGPDVEAELVRYWARPIFTHFPCLEVLEAWGDFKGQDHESLNYFLPNQEILASTWEFLSGVEQDLWEDDEVSFEEEEREDLEDWEQASSMNEFHIEEQSACYDDSGIDIGKLSIHVQDADELIVPGTA